MALYMIHVKCCFKIWPADVAIGWNVSVLSSWVHFGSWGTKIQAHYRHLLVRTEKYRHQR